MLLAMQVAEAKRGHQQYVDRVLDFMSRFDLLCCPCAMVAPFDVNIRYAFPLAESSLQLSLLFSTIRLMSMAYVNCMMVTAAAQDTCS